MQRKMLTVALCMQTPLMRDRTTQETLCVNCQSQEQRQPNGPPPVHEIPSVAVAGMGAVSEAQQDVDSQADPRLGPYARQTSRYASWLTLRLSCSELVKWTGWESIEDHWPWAASSHRAEELVMGQAAPRSCPERPCISWRG